MASENKIEQPILAFSSQSEWRKWLEQNHALSNGIWLQFYKKGSGTSTVVYAEALDEALCFGWIDGQLKRGDENFYLQRFTPRRARSGWSKRNIGLVARLEKEEKLHPAGQKAIEAAKADGRWDSAYDSPGNMNVPDELMLELANVPESLSFFESLDKVNKYSFCWRIQSAKNQIIKEKRMKVILEMLAKGEKIHP